MADELLVISNLTKSFGGITAVDDVSFTIPSASIHALIGPNGAGKTTVLNLITGLYKSTSGTITLAGQKISDLSPVAIANHGISRTFQNVRLFNTMTVLDNVTVATHKATPGRFVASVFGAPSYRREKEQVREEARDVLELVGLWHERDRVVAGLPFGQRHMVEIARALVRKPHLLLLDEPSGGLVRSEIDRLVEAIHTIEGRGIAILLVEHNMQLVMGISHHVIVLDFGKKVAEGPPEVVRKDPKVIEAYLGRRRERVGAE